MATEEGGIDGTLALTSLRVQGSLCDVRPLPVVPLVRPLRRGEVTEREWSDWRWQLRNRLTTADDLARFVALTDDERAGIAVGAGLFRIGLPPYYAELMDPVHDSCPIRMQVIPRPQEACVAAGEYRDPLGEDALAPTRAIVHRYPDRVLLLALDRCAVYCRHCNRRRMVGQDDGVISKDDLNAAIDYIRGTPQIRDVLVSGGDPLTLSTDKLAWILGEVRAIPHVDFIRIGTRVPVALPMRVDAELCAMLRRFHPLYINTHFNHPKELTPEARAACEKLADAGIPLGNQCVLLRGVNSQARTLEVLFRGLLRSRIKPYYLFQGDPVEGTDHLRTPVSAGIEIMRSLRGRVTGMAMPHLVIDAPGGGGKIPIGPTYVEAVTDGELRLRNWEGRPVRYVEPAVRDLSCAYDEIYFGGGSA
jgi:lysine 2,3-aminomutase